MLSNNTKKINTTLTFRDTRPSNLIVKNNFSISTCTLYTNCEKKSKELTSPHSSQSVTFSPTQHFHTHGNLNASLLKERRGEKLTVGKLQLWEHMENCSCGNAWKTAVLGTHGDRKSVV
jgi:hypothetical protein